RRQFDRRQRALGLRAWMSADVLPFDAFVPRLWQACCASPRASPGASPRALPRGPQLLLNPWQLRAIWEDIIRDDIRGHEDPLWNTHATARLAVDAWQLAQDWRIDPAACAASAHDDHRSWARWARRYRKRCAARNWVDAHCIAEQCIGMLREHGAPAPAAGIPEKIIATGFDQFPPQQQALLDALRDAGIQVEIDAPARADANAPEIRVCEDPAGEWLQAACWAREKLMTSPTASPQLRIAIVAPNLNRAARAIEYACKQILCPREMLAPGLRAALPYHIALGENLSEYPVANAALVALAPFAGAALSAEAVSRMLCSPFLRGARSEAAARGRQERWCRRRLPYQIRFSALLKALSPDNAHAKKPHCPILFDALRAAKPLLQHAGQAKPAGHWARIFTDWLERLGWPGELALDSDEYQAARAFRRELQHLALLELTAAPMRAAAALAWLRRRLAEQPFQVEAHDAPLQVLGVREAAGQHFDALWFGGMVEADWPPPPHASPFIAAKLQQDAGIPGASLEGAREHAARLQQRLLASAGEVVLSRPRMQDDIEAEPSALLDDIADGADAAVTTDAAAAARAITPANILRAHRPELESFTDTRAPAFAPGLAPGGVSVIENQAKCPFRAFAIHRLGARDSQENEQGLAPFERGQLMHHALQLLWEKLGDSETLHALAAVELREMAAAAAHQASERHRISSGCGARFLAAQAKWAGDTLHEWLENEKRRGAHFRARHLEQQTELQLGGLELTMKIDRVDQLENGEMALIDYKTGRPGGVGDWASRRPQSPQLPLYALAQDAPPAALLYGAVRRGECAFHGLAREDDFIQNAGAQKNIASLEKNRALKNDFADWDALLAHWRKVLPKLAEEFLAGDARVDPLPAACAQCGLHGLCRVDARA
ncbi:MAG: PD-(D/E)XK nuclease family protein, partial [Gammaproteobacteria bacterium]